MKKVMRFIICAMMLFGPVTAGYAQYGDWHGETRMRIHEAIQRIDRGIERGSLTRHEANRLREELDNILQQIDRMKADGFLSPREQDIINRNLERLDQDIAREKNDDDNRSNYNDSDWRGGIRARIHEAKQRIDRGMERGSLTHHEANRLREELGNILDQIDRMKEDGFLSPRERDAINRNLDRLDKDITREKNDDDVRGEHFRGRHLDRRSY